MDFDWDRLKTFYMVAETGSFTSAMKRLNLSQSAISRQISSLEESIGTILFHRHARGIVLTEQGMILYSTAKEIFEKLKKTQERLVENKDLPSGILKINTTVSLGSVLLSPIMQEFKKKYPDIECHVICTENQMDLAMLEADVAVSYHPATSAGLVQKKILHGNIYAYASPLYLETKGTPTKKQDLIKHDLILYDQTLYEDNDIDFNWLLKLGEQEYTKLRPYLAINNLHGMYRMARSGAGIVSLPEFMENLPGTLQRVLPKEKGPEFDIYIIYPEEYRKVQKVQLFKDFLVEKTR